MWGPGFQPSRPHRPLSEEALGTTWPQEYGCTRRGHRACSRRIWTRLSLRVRGKAQPQGLGDKAFRETGGRCRRPEGSSGPSGIRTEQGCPAVGAGRGEILTQGKEGHPQGLGQGAGPGLRPQLRRGNRWRRPSVSTLRPRLRDLRTGDRRKPGASPGVPSVTQTQGHSEGSPLAPGNPEGKETVLGAPERRQVSSWGSRWWGRGRTGLGRGLSGFWTQLSLQTPV